jgi:hypothetical protein
MGYAYRGKTHPLSPPPTQEYICLAIAGSLDLGIKYSTFCSFITQISKKI